ncbi:hypothetical protein F5Y04DRAFT_257035 [Hypomontagnella monticulosa]|nr:hypothetical protein F5Y04DRAFT_257035 [Hypomontagnella monticulosa]
MLQLTPFNGAPSFIVTTPADQSVEANRRLIRSHVMRGKNRKKLPPKPPSWINGIQGYEEDHMNRGHSFPIPNKVGGELSLTHFSSKISPATFDAIRKLKHAMSPLDVGLPSTRNDVSWFEPIQNDVACLHFTIFIAKTYQDIVRGQKESQTALAHFIKSLGILQRRIASANHELSTSNSTILVVAGLAMAATALGDLDAAVNHLKGLHEMVALRGGISALLNERQLQAKILRVDLEVALATGSRPLFFSDGVSWGTYIAIRRRIPSGGGDPKDSAFPTDLENFFHGLDTRLQWIWDDMSELVRSLHIATLCKLGIDSDLYQEAMVSIHYRLLNLYFDINDTNESVRLALLGLASTLFLQWRGAKTRYEYLARRYRNALSRLTLGGISMPPQLSLWLYIIGVILIFDDDEKTGFQRSLKESLSSMEIKSWDETKLSLKSVLWADVLNVPAKSMVKITLSST